MLKDNYTKMCNCPEIQDGWEPKVGDWTDCGIISEYMNADSIIVYNQRSGHFPEFGLDELKWLPTIEQLMEMVWVKLGTYCSNKMNSLTWGVWDFYNTTTDDADSGQELWLRYFMHELHNKSWNGERWE